MKKNKNKLSSFTLSELLVVLIITTIVIGMAFSVLRLVQREIHAIQTNYDKTSSLVLFEQRLWKEVNQLHDITYTASNETLAMVSETDTVLYSFKGNYVLRNADTIALKLRPIHFLFEGKTISEGKVDGIYISADEEVKGYELFISKKNDLTYCMNQ